MASLRHDEDLDQEIDYNFFDDDDNDKDKSEINNNNNNAYAEKSPKIENFKKTDSNDILKASVDDNSVYNSGSINISSGEELDSDSSSAAAATSSKNSSKSSNNQSKSPSERSSHKSSPPKSSPNTPALSGSPELISRRSPVDSDVTTVSSLDSEPRRLKSAVGGGRGGRLSNHTHVEDGEDVDRVQPEAILRAMIRIHEERRAMRQLRPKWVDPTTKDYSVSGITKKINLVPEKIVTLPRKNTRENPFYTHYQHPPRRPYHTALNRLRELERIEKENRTIYDRLKKIQPSPGITKQELLKEYTKVNRFSFPSNFSPFTIPTTSSYRTQTATNSRSSSQARRTHSSASIHKSELEPESMSQKYSNGRVMSSGSLNSHQMRSNSMIDRKKTIKK